MADELKRHLTEMEQAWFDGNTNCADDACPMPIALRNLAEARAVNERLQAAMELSKAAQVQSAIRGHGSAELAMSHLKHRTAYVALRDALEQIREIGADGS